jgi:hypothetical protein
MNWAKENGFRSVNFGETLSDETNSISKFKKAFEGELIPKHRF